MHRHGERGAPQFRRRSADDRPELPDRPHAHIVGATVEAEVFLATGCAVFTDRISGAGAEVGLNGVVHLRTRLAPGATVPIGWVAVGDPAQMLPASEHDAIWGDSGALNFPLTVYGLQGGEADMVRITQRLPQALGSHLDDKAVG